MENLKAVVQTQIDTIQKKTGKSFAKLTGIVKESGLSQHSQIRTMLVERLGLGYGDTNALVHAVLKTDGARSAEANGLDEIYIGPRAALLPIHETLLAQIETYGEFEILPKKNYVSLRRKKQFAMIGPGTNTRIDLGLNAKDLPSDPRLLEQPMGSMCNYIVRLSGLLRWVW